MSLPGFSGSGAGVSSSSVDIGDNVAYSLMLDSGSSQYLSRTQTTSGTWTLSCWVKRGKLSAAMGVLEGAGFLFNAGDTITAGALTTTAVYRDTAGWYHIHISNNGLYVNGVLLGAVTTGVLTNPDIGRNSTSYFDGYLADFIFLDNDTVAYTSFGRTSADTGAWVHKTYSGSYTAGSYHLDFADSADLGNDVSGNNNDWTTNGGISSANQYTDTPTNNYAVLNPLDVTPIGAGTLTVGNLKATTASVPDQPRATIWQSSGKWVAEWTVTTVGNSTRFGVLGSTANIQAGTGTYTTYNNDGNKELNGTATAYGATFTTGDVIRCEWDADSGNLEFFKNGTSQGTIPSITGTRTFGAYISTSTVGVANFGAVAFTGTPTSGFLALSTANLTAPAILDPSDHFFAKTRTGTGASYSVTGLNFQPDLVWVKGRSGATDHAIYDAVRGATYQLESNTTTDETTEATGLTAFNSDGYSGGALAQMNTNTATYIDWMWNESVTAGLDIVSYTGNGANRTINHGLGVVPKMIIIKSRATAGADTNWAVYHASLANTEYLLLNSTGAKATGATYWNSTTPTSSVFSLGTHADVNTNSDTYIAYCFAEIEGFSKFGSYTGNGSTDGVFVYCGFRPRWIMTKCSSTTGDWRIYDTARPGYNVQGGTLLADTAGAETTTAELDILSNGFKARITTDPNSAQTFVFAAFSELPMKYATAR